MRAVKKALKWIALIVGALALAVVIAGLAAHERRPEGRRSEAAEALARRMEDAIDLAAWERTRAVEWNFGGRHRHLWDRDRRLVRVTWGELEALIHEAPRGRVFRGGRELSGDEAREALEAAYAYWINDSFWLNPLAKMRDAGVSRELVRHEGADALLVRYSSGGLTPGDAYLWMPSESGLPRAWKMWVSILPIGGVEASWERWITLSTGAKISTGHRGPLGFELELTDVRGAATLAELVERDPFAPLFERTADAR